MNPGKSFSEAGREAWRRYSGRLEEAVSQRSENGATAIQTTTREALCREK